MLCSITPQHVVAYPVSRGTLINFIAFVTVDEYGTTYSYRGRKNNSRWVHDESTEYVVAQFAGWEPEVMALLKVGPCLHRE